MPLFIMAATTTELSVIYVVQFWLGVATIGRFTCGFVLLTELVPEKSASLAGTSYMIGDAVCTLYYTFYFRYISKDSLPLWWVSLFLNVVGFGLTFFIPESPKWLVSQGQYQQAKRNFKKIAKMNGVENF